MRLIHILRVSSLLIFSATLACSQASEEQCDKAFDRYFDLKEQGTPAVIRKVNAIEFEEKRPQFLSQCVGRINPSVISCWLNADTLEQLLECEVDSPILR